MWCRISPSEAAVQRCIIMVGTITAVHSQLKAKYRIVVEVVEIVGMVVEIWACV